MRAYGAADMKVYTGAVAVVVESALPFTIFSVAYLITYAMGSDVAYAFSFYAMFTVGDHVIARIMWLSGISLLHASVHLSIDDHHPRPIPESMDQEVRHALHYDHQLQGPNRLRDRWRRTDAIPTEEVY